MYASPDTDIVPYDSTRVKLPSRGDSPDTYINASWIREPTPAAGTPVARSWIAAQAPTEPTVHDFLSLFFHPPGNASGPSATKAPRTILMLTACIESGRHKSARYWPEQVGASLSFSHYTTPTASPHRQIQRAELVPGPLPPIRVEYLDCTPSSSENARAGRGWRTNKLRLSASGTDPVDINHIEYLGWQDHGVPDSPAEVLRLVDYLNTLIEPDEPVVTHCSAGVGRTGSFISIAWLLSLLAAYRAKGGKACLALEPTSPLGPLPPLSQRHTGVLSSLVHETKDGVHDEDGDPVMAVIDRCRDQRTTMVQTPAQVEFVYEAARTWWQQQEQSTR